MRAHHEPRHEDPAELGVVGHLVVGHLAHHPLDLGLRHRHCILAAGLSAGTRGSETEGLRGDSSSIFQPSSGFPCLPHPGGRAGRPSAPLSQGLLPLPPAGEHAAWSAWPPWPNSSARRRSGRATDAAPHVLPSTLGHQHQQREAAPQRPRQQPAASRCAWRSSATARSASSRPRSSAGCPTSRSPRWRCPASPAGFRRLTGQGKVRFSSWAASTPSSGTRRPGCGSI